LLRVRQVAGGVPSHQTAPLFRQRFRVWWGGVPREADDVSDRRETAEECRPQQPG
jgi:hypothetical protein